VNETNTDKRDYVHQRFRVKPKIKVSDNVSANLRFDFAEGRWGQDQNFTTQRAKDTGFSDIQVDRAYVDVKTEWIRVRAGLQFVPAGQTQVFQDNQPALQFNIKTGTPFGVRLAWIKVDEGIGSMGTSVDRLNDSQDEYKDTDRYLGVLSYDTDFISANAFYVAQIDGSTADTDGDGQIDNFEDQPWVAGLRFRGLQFGSLSFHGELAQFGGDDGNNTDYTGTQFNLNAKYNMNDSLAFGFDFIYSSAQGDDDKKITYMGNPFAGYDAKFGSTRGWSMLTYGRYPGQLYTSSPPGGPLPGDFFDPFKTGAGAITAGIGAMYRPLEKMTLIGQFHYMTAADDDIAGVTGEFESGYNLLMAAVYQIAPKTSVHATYQRVDADFMDGVEPDASNLYGLRLHVAF
jgi:hypothetical protein